MAVVVERQLAPRRSIDELVRTHEADVRKRHSSLRRFPWIPGGILALLLISALGAPLFAPHDPIAFDISKGFLPPVWEEGGTWEHILGTDRLGRDLFSRLIYGGRIALMVSGIALSFSLAIEIGRAPCRERGGRYG